MGKRILLVDDEPLMLKGLKFTLEQEGYETDLAMDGEEALAKFQAQPFDLVLLDVMLPKLDGLSVCQRIREQSNVPIIMLTAKGEDMDKILGLEYGADDYIAKPFGVMELVARVKAVLRRCAAPEHGDVLRCGEIQLDAGEHSVHVGEDEVQLTLKEFSLLRLLMENHGRLMERERLIQRVWGSGCADANHTLDAHMRTLRAKLGAGGNRIQTVYGRGYRLRDGE